MFKSRISSKFYTMSKYVKIVIKPQCSFLFHFDLMEIKPICRLYKQAQKSMDKKSDRDRRTTLGS